MKPKISRIKSIFNKIIYTLHIKEICPNCESAWTEGCKNPETREFCIVCGSKENEDGSCSPKYWVWGWIVPRFIKQWQMDVRYVNHRAGFREGKQCTVGIYKELFIHKKDV